MMPILKLAAKSLMNRWATAALTLFTIAISTGLLLGVERLRTEARISFSNTISGADLIVGARSGAVQLLLYSVFRIGNATNNITMESYDKLKKSKAIAWTIPISLGDSHKGYRVLGTNGDYFRHYRYGRKQKLAFKAGKPFSDLFDVVLGAEVARALNYKLGDRIVIAHGLGRAGLTKHDATPFAVSGILAPTGTPVDRTVHVSLEAIEAIHVDWKSGAKMPGRTTPADAIRRMDLRPHQITAFIIGLKSKLAVFRQQRRINNFNEEPLLAILPGVTLLELWGLMGTAEKALLAISWLVVASGILGMLAVILSGLNERRREMAILRSVGARPAHLAGLMTAEAGVLTLAGVVAGIALHYLAIAVARPFIRAEFGIDLPFGLLTSYHWALLGAIFAAGLLIGLIPAWRAYRYTVSDGLIVRT